MTESDFLMGWVDEPAEVERIMSSQPVPTWEDAAPHLKDSGKGKVVLLHKILTQVAPAFPVRAQTIGDCVSQGWACAIDILTCVEIALLGQAEMWVAETATEVIYGGGRVQIADGRLGRRDGLVGAYAAQFVKEYGAIARGKYGDIDLTVYDGNRAKKWGMPNAGVPEALIETVKQYPVKQITSVTSYEAARDAIANGYPVPVASNQGFAMQRDEKGFARPKGSWNHQMCFISVDDADSRPGLLCMNSWGPNWISGPTRHDQPPGSFWVDAEVATRMLRQGDSHSAADRVGYPAKVEDVLKFKWM